MTRSSTWSLAGWLLLLIAAAAQAGRAEAPKPTDTQFRELEKRLDALSQQLDRLASEQDAAAREGLMQKSWRDMQGYLGWMHGQLGAGLPWMAGPGMLHGDWASCPALGGPGPAWPTPEGVSPEAYAGQMREHMTRMREQVSQLLQTPDRQKRQLLLQEHWQTLYRDMQTLRGLGWMWGTRMGPGTMGPGMMGGRPASALPDAGSPGARLVADYCTQCHAAPSPTLHTRDEWASVEARMQEHIVAGPAVRAPSAGELQAILGYLQAHAR
jgi:hypothetical protein